MPVAIEAQGVPNRNLEQKKRPTIGLRAPRVPLVGDPFHYVRSDIPGVPNEILKKKESSIAGFHNLLIDAASDPTQVPNPRRIEREIRDLAALSKKTPADPNSDIRELLGACTAWDDVQYVHEITSRAAPFDSLADTVTKTWKKKPSVLTTMASTLRHLRDRGQMDPQALDQARSLVSAFKKTVDHFGPVITRQKTVPKVVEWEPDNNVVNPKEFAKSWGRSRNMVDTTGVHHKGAIISLVDAHEAEVGVIETLDPRGTSVETYIPLIDGEITYAVTVFVEEGGEWSKVELREPIDEADFDPTTNVQAQRDGLWTSGVTDKSRYAIAVQTKAWEQDIKVKEHQDTGMQAMFVNKADELKFLEVVTSFNAEHAKLADIFSINGEDEVINLQSSFAEQLLQFLESNGESEILDLPVLGETKGKDTLDKLALDFTVRVGVFGSDVPVPLAALIYPPGRREPNKEILPPRKGEELRDRVPGSYWDAVAKAASGEAGEARTEITEQEIFDRKQIIDLLGISPDDDRGVMIYTKGVTHRAKGSSMEYWDGHSTTLHKQAMFIEPLAHDESGPDGPAHGNTVQVRPFLSRTEDVERDTNNPAGISTLGELLTYIAWSGGPNELKLPPPRILAPQIVAAIRAERNEDPLFYNEQEDGHLESAQPLAAYLQGFGDATTSFGESENSGNSRVDHSTPVLALPMREIGLVAEFPAALGAKRRTRRHHKDL